MKVQVVNFGDEVLYESVVIIDIYTFSTTANILAAKNPKKILCMSGEFEDSSSVHSKMKDTVLIDDVVRKPDLKNKMINGDPLFLHYMDSFDGTNFEDLTFLYRSTNGTRVLNSFLDKKNVFVASFVNLESLKKVLDALEIKEVSLVACGGRRGPNTDDFNSALYMKYYLENDEHDESLFKKLVREMIAADESGDFFEKYGFTDYGKLLGFNLSFGLSDAVLKVDEKLENGIISLINCYE